MDLDEILEEVGHFGKFQAKNYFLISFPILLAGIYSLSYVFTAGDLDYRCFIPECEGESMDFNPEWLKYAVPFPRNSHLPSRCQRYPPANSSTINSSFCSRDQFDNSTETKCDEWVYDGEEVTIVNEFGINCDDNAWKLTLVGTLNNVGQFVGFPLAGFVSDRLGRKTTFVASMVVCGMVGLARSLAWSYESFLVFEFLDPVAGSGAYTSGFTLSLELVGPRARVLGGTLISLFYALGEAVLGGLAWWLLNWRHILRVAYIPGILCVAYNWFLPESVRWLLTKGRIDEAKAIILDLARTNNTVLSEQVMSKIELTSMLEEKPNKPDVKTRSASELLKDVLHSKILLLRVVACSFCWIAITFVFYGLSLTSVSVGGNKFTNFILVACIELPAYLVCYFIMDNVGRKFTLSASLVLSGLCCLAFAFVPLDLDWVRLLLFLAGKFAITISFNVVYIYTAEFFPTELRQSLLGICAMFGRFGSMLAPQTPLLDHYLYSLPLILFGGSAVVAGFISLNFPETLHMKLPDTVEEAENIGKNS